MAHLYTSWPRTGPGSRLVQWLVCSFSQSEELAELTLEALQRTDVTSIFWNGRQTAEKHTYNNQQELWSEFFFGLF